jgi:hypothetical protein
MVLAMDSASGLAAGGGLGGGADRDAAADALAAMEALSLEGSGRGRSLLRPHLTAAGGMGVSQPY